HWAGVQTRNQWRLNRTCRSPLLVVVISFHKQERHIACALCDGECRKWMDSKAGSNGLEWGLLTIAVHCSKGTMMYEAFRATLSALREQFARAADRHPELYFEEVGVSFEGDDPQEEMWKNFIAANRGEDGKEEWYISKRTNVCGRFHG